MYLARRRRDVPIDAPDNVRSRSSRSRPRVALRVASRVSGQSLVEFSLLLPVLLLLLVVAVDFGRLFATYVAVNNAAREAVAFASIHPTFITSTDSPDPENVTYRARLEVTTPSDPRFTSVTVTTPTCTPSPCPTVLGSGGGTTIKVSVRTSFTFLTPLVSAIVGGSIQLNGSAAAAIQ